MVQVVLQTNTNHRSVPTRQSGGGVLGSLAAMTLSSAAVFDRKEARQSSYPAEDCSPPYRRNSSINNFYVPPPYRRGQQQQGQPAQSAPVQQRRSPPPPPRHAHTARNQTEPSSSSSSHQMITTAPDEEEAYRRQRTTDFKVGRNLFNRNPEQGLAYMILRGFVQPNPTAIATMFSSRLGFNRQRIGEFLSTPSSQSQLAASVLSRLAASVDMSRVDLDIALRRFLALFHLPGEAQRIERILRVFAHHYCIQNEPAFAFLPSGCNFSDKCDTALLLAYAIVMLNTDLHSPAIRECRMSQSDFICNFQGAGKNASTMPAETLAAIYERIRLTPLTPSEDNTTNVSRIEEAILARRQTLVAPHRRLVCYCCQVELKGDPLRGSQNQATSNNEKQKTSEKPPVANSSSNNSQTSRRCSFPASITEGLRNRQTDAKHGAERQLFLFNDLLVLTKLARRRQQQQAASKRQSLGSSSSANSSHQNQQQKQAEQKEAFVFRRSLPLSSLSFATFSTPTAPFGLRITTVEENSKLPSTLYFCARSAEDHQHFVQDLQEAIAEAALTEAARLDLEKCPLPLLDKLFDPSDFEDVSSIIGTEKAVRKTTAISASSLGGANNSQHDDCSPTSTPQRRSEVGSGSASTSSTEVGDTRLLRRHSRTSLDSGVGEIGSQMSIAVANSTSSSSSSSASSSNSRAGVAGDATGNKVSQLFAVSRSAEKHAPCDAVKVAAVLSPEPTACAQKTQISSGEVVVNPATLTKITAKKKLPPSIAKTNTSRARSFDALC